MRRRAERMPGMRIAGICLILMGIIAATGRAGERRRPDTDLFSLSGTLATWTIQSLDHLEPLADGTVVTAVRLDGREFVLALEPYSVRGDEFVLEIQLADGAYLEIDPPPSATYRGTVTGVPGSRVAASLVDGRLSAIIRLAPETVWVVEPLASYAASSPTADHVVYRVDDALPTDRVCGGGVLEAAGGAARDIVDPASFDMTTPSAGPGAGPRAVQTVELACDADYEYYQVNGGSVPNTVVDIEKIINAVEVVYQRDVEICLDLTHIIVRTSSNDPYSGSDPNTLLNQFRSHWLSQQQNIPRDIAHLFTGRNLNGNVIGIAWLSGVCNSYGYGLSQSHYTANFNNRTALTAHEIGHNWSASHCDGDADCHIMCSGINGCGGVGLPNFGSRAVSEITNYKASRPCLDDGCGEVLDITEPDPGTPGDVSTISVRGAGSSATVEFFFGVSTGATPVPGCGGLDLGLQNARAYAVATANGDGIATVTMTVPPGASGRSILLQAADETNCVISDIQAFTFP